MSVAIQQAAKAARVRGMSAEHLVIWVKHVWDELVDEGVLQDRMAPAHARDAVVSAVIKAYYVQ